LIAFKPAAGCVHFRAVPICHGTVVFFTGVWRERDDGECSETKRTRRVSGRRPGKSGGKPGGRLQK
ncbi:MAG: hypothetical protein ACREDH_05920, partial [Methylocella sp.]